MLGPEDGLLARLPRVVGFCFLKGLSAEVQTPRRHGGGLTTQPERAR